MSRKPNPPHDDPEESTRFIDMAREVGSDEGSSGKMAFERALKKIISPKPKSPKRQDLE